MAEYSQQKVVRGTGSGQRRRFLQIARQVSATIGIEFFEGLVKHLASALDADCVYIGEFIGGQVERVRTLAACLDGELMKGFEYPLAGSPDSEVAIGNPCVFSQGVQELFPSHALLRKVDAEACIGLPLNDANGQPTGLIVALYRRPVADEARFMQSMLSMFLPRAAAELNRKQADDALREGEQRHRAFIMLNNDAMWRIEFEQPIDTKLPEDRQLDTIFKVGYVAECNDALARMVGADKAEQLIGSRVTQLWRHHSIESARESFISFIRSGYRFGTIESTPVDNAGKQRYFMRSQWGIVENGVLQRIWGTNRDITELRQSQIALANSERRLTDLLESLHLVAIMLDHKEVVTFCNNHLLKLTGWRAEEILGKNWFDLTAPTEEREKLRAVFRPEASNGSGPAHFESTLLARDGSRRTIEWDVVTLRDAGGAITGSAAVGRDITDYRALEAQFRQVQKLESIGRLAGGVAHDFNNLLTIVRGYSALLLEHMDKTDQAYAGLVEIKKAADKGAGLTSQLLTFSRRQTPRPQLLNVNAVIAEDEAMLRRLIGEDIELTADLDPNLGLVLADPGNIHQVIMNLAVNARDAMPNGGKLILGSLNVDLGEHRAARLKAIEPGRYVHLIIADTGVGMNQEVQAHLFEPFFTTKELSKGTGLGLSTVYGIIRQSGGHIVVESKPGKGTTFEIFLPRVEPPAVTAPSPEAEASPGISSGTETILLVEDQNDLRALLVIILRDHGYTVLEANGGEQALLLIERQHGNINLVVTDVVMPGMSGVELAERVTAANAKTKVLFISGYSDTPPLERSAYLQKPFPPKTLAAKVREILDQT